LTLTFIPGESVAKEEENVWYYGGYSGLGRMMVGHLVLTNRRIILYEKKPVKKALETIGVAIDIPLEKIVAVKFEERGRSPSSRPRWDNPKIYRQTVEGLRRVNLPPNILNGREVYSALMVAIEDEAGLESPTFEVRDPLGWLNTVSKFKGRKSWDTDAGR